MATKDEIIDRAIAAGSRYSREQLADMGLRELMRESAQPGSFEPVGGVAAPSPMPVPVPPATTGAAGDAGAALAALVAPFLPRPEVDLGAAEQRVNDAISDGVREIERRAAAFSMPQRIEIAFPGRPVFDPGLQHRQFGDMARLVAAADGVGVVGAWLHGAPGSGKTQAAQNYATAMGAEFRAYAFSSQTTLTSLVGFHTPAGAVVHTVVREAVEHGGVLLLDEFDKIPSGVAVALNTILSQRYMLAPDGLVPVHPDLRIIACANTPGLGASAGHESAVRVDAALRDRFVFLPWAYDPALERAIALGINAASSPWIEWCHAIRAACAITANLQAWRFAGVTSRAIYACARLSGMGGWSPAEIAEMAVFKGHDPVIVARMLAECPLPRALRVAAGVGK